MAPDDDRPGARVGLDLDGVLHEIGRRAATLPPGTKRRLETALRVQMAGLTTATVLLELWGRAATAITEPPPTASPAPGSDLERAFDTQRRLVRFGTGLPRLAALVFLGALARRGGEDSGSRARDSG